MIIRLLLVLFTLSTFQLQSQQIEKIISPAPEGFPNYESILSLDNKYILNTVEGIYWTAKDDIYWQQILPVEYSELYKKGNDFLYTTRSSFLYNTTCNSYEYGVGTILGDFNQLENRLLNKESIGYSAPGNFHTKRYNVNYNKVHFATDSIVYWFPELSRYTEGWLNFIPYAYISYDAGDSWKELEIFSNYSYDSFDAIPDIFRRGKVLKLKDHFVLLSQKTLYKSLDPEFTNRSVDYILHEVDTFLNDITYLDDKFYAFYADRILLSTDELESFEELPSVGNFIKNENGFLYFSNEGEYFKTSDLIGGEKIILSDDFDVTSFREPEFPVLVDDEIFFTYDDLLQLSDDGGKTWQEADKCKWDFEGEILTFIGDEMWVRSSQGQRLTYRSYNSKQDWEAVDISGFSDEFGNTISYEKFSGHKNHLFLRGSTDGENFYLFRSADNGDTWEEISEQEVDKLFIEEDFIYLVSNDKLFVSEDEGNRWKESLLPENSSTNILFSENTLLIRGAESNYFFSENNGEHWEEISLPSSMTYIGSNLGSSEFIFNDSDLKIWVYNIDSKLFEQRGEIPFDPSNCPPQEGCFIRELVAQDSFVYAVTSKTYYSDHTCEWVTSNNYLISNDFGSNWHTAIPKVQGSYHRGLNYYINKGIYCYPAELFTYADFFPKAFSTSIDESIVLTTCIDGAIDLNFTITNDGINDYSGPIDIGFRFGSNYWQGIIRETCIIEIKSGEQINLTKTITIPDDYNLDSGEDEIIIQVNWNRGIRENSYSDNDVVQSIVIKDHETEYVTNQIDVCEGEYFLGEQIFNDTLFIDADTINSSCIDSIISYEVFLHHIDDFFIYETICEGDSVVSNNQVFYTEGIYILSTIQDSQTGCDRSVVLDLSILDKFSEITTEAICEGESIIIDGVSYSERGTYLYQSTQYTATGCDSLLSYLELVVNTVEIDTLLADICEGESLELNGMTFTEPGLYLYEEYQHDNSSCDSILNYVQLGVLPSIHDTFYLELTLGDSIAGMEITADTTITETYFDEFNCANTNTYIVDLITSSQDVAQDAFEMKLYPNPFSNELNLQLEIDDASVVNVAVLSVDGRRLHNVLDDEPLRSGKNVFNLNLANTLEAGVYMIEIEIDGLRDYQLVVKQ